MFCPKCGNQVKDGASFCNNCGEQISDKNSSPEKTQQMQPQQTQQMPAQNPAENASANTQNTTNNNTNEGMSKGKIIGLVCAICGVVITVAVAVVIIVCSGNKEADIKLNINIDGYADTTSTGLPVIIEGEDGSENQYINGNGDGLTLKKGDYKLSFPAGPLCENGDFFTTPTDYCSISITNNKAEIAYSGNKEEIKYPKADITQVTDKQINDALIYAKESNHNADKAEKYAQNTRDARDTAIAAAEKKAQVEAAAAAEKAKADKKAKAATQLVSGKYVNTENSAITMVLDLEGKKATFYKNGVIYANGKLLDRSQMREGREWSNNWWIDECGIDIVSVATDDVYKFSGTGTLTISNGVVLCERAYCMGGGSAGESVDGYYSFVE